MEETILQPETITIPLYEHQKRSVFLMEKMETTRLGITPPNSPYTLETSVGIYADKAGYGKTLGILSLISRNQMPWDISTPYVSQKIKSYSESKIKRIISETRRRINSTLILVSSSILKQWEQELKKTSLSHLSVSTSRTAQTAPDPYDIVLITPTFFNDYVLSQNVAFKRFVFDEPSTLRVSAMKTVYAGFIWLISATPYSISHNHRKCRQSFMYNLTFDWNYNNIIEHIIIKNSDEFIDLSYSMPPSSFTTIECYSPFINIIRSFASPKITELVEMGDIRGAVRCLGGKILSNDDEKSDNIILLLTRRKETELRTIRAQIPLFEELRPHKVEELKQKEQRILSQIEDLKNKYSDLLNKNCPICQDKLTNPITEIGCQNIFCGQCLLTWLSTKGTCPMCRCDVSSKDLVYLSSETSQPQTKLPTKEQAISTIIKPNRKVLLFSQHDGSFQNIRTYLAENKIAYVEVKGTPESRDKALLEYRTSNETNVLFLNSRYNDSGLNLQETTDIILYHKMPESTIKQVLGRANRIGRTQPLSVYRLEYSNE